MMEVEDDDEVKRFVQKTQQDQREYVACLKCTHDCFYAPHSGPSAPPSAPSRRLPPTAPSFLKVLDDPSSSWLEIPGVFVTSFLGNCTGEAKLEGPSGWVWYAPFMHDARNNLGKVVLGSPGWDDFAHDHMLQRGDLLVFTYFSVHQLFKIQIFDAIEGTEKSQHCLPSKPHYVNQATTSTMELQGHNNKNRVQPKGDSTKHMQVLTSGHLCQIEESKNQTSKPDAMMNRKSVESKVVKCCNCESFSYKETTDDQFAETEKESEEVDRLNCKTRSLEQKLGVSKHPVSDEHEEELDNSKALVLIQQESKQLSHEKKWVPLGRYKLLMFNEKGMYNPYATASPAEKERVEKEAKAFHSKYPFLIKSLSASSIHKDRKLMWPKAFTDAYMPKSDTWMTWIDHENNQWKCLWLPRRSCNRAVSFVSAGWAKFVQGHHLIEHDVCIFELINQEAVCFRVHLFKQGPL